MSQGVYFRKETILHDFNRFGIAAAERLNADVTIIDEELDGKQSFGYYIIKDNKEFRVTMEYKQNIYGEYAVKSEEFTIKYNDSITNGFKTLGDVFEFINSH